MRSPSAKRLRASGEKRLKRARLELDRTFEALDRGDYVAARRHNDEAVREMREAGVYDEDEYEDE